MATTTHYIRSDYDPEDRKRLEIETGQAVGEEELDVEEAWQREAAKVAAQRKRPPPRFVPASLDYDLWGFNNLETNTQSKRPIKADDGSVSSWYRALTKLGGSSSAEDRKDIALNPISSQSSAADNSSRSTPVAETEAETKSVDSRPPERLNKNNWFISKALQVAAAEVGPSTSSVSRTPTLAEILDRNPPDGDKFKPRVWLAIGPGNRGYGMLHRAGWNEGEPLGPHVIRKRPLEEIDLADEDILPLSPRAAGKRRATAIQKQQVEVKMEGYDGVSEIRNVDIIDLTLSSDEEGDDADGNGSRDDVSSGADSGRGDGGNDFIDGPGGSDVKEEEDEGDMLNRTAALADGVSERLGIGCLSGTATDASVGTSSSGGPSTSEFAASGRKALLTPIATVLKTDRLGIGLKAKTVGPYKASLKRVTHGEAALRAHRMAAEESRKKRQLYGRGKRGFEKQHRREEENRKAMISYFNN